MKKTLPIFLIIFALFSCTKDEYQPRELNITCKSTNGIGNLHSDGVYFFPNPFYDKIYGSIYGSNQADILISNDKGDFKKINVQIPSFVLNFTNERSGVYYCEVLTNNKLYKAYLIKINP